MNGARFGILELTLWLQGSEAPDAECDWGPWKPAEETEATGDDDCDHRVIVPGEDYDG